MKRIYLTIDIECHDINKRNQYIDGKTKNGYYGLKHILDLARELKIPVNCFLDIPEVKEYGDCYIREIISLIEEYNQHVYLHLHPDYITGNHDKSFLWEYSKEEKIKIIDEGCRLYQHYTGHKVDYFRVGRYGADPQMYDALTTAVGNICDLSYCTRCSKMCHLEYSDVKTNNKAVNYKGHTILPNTRYIGLKLGNRSVFINFDASDSTYNEFTRLITGTRLNQLVFTMHSWNFIKKYYFLKKYVTLDSYEEKKFRKMIEFARKNGFEFCDLHDTPPLIEEQVEDEVIDMCRSFSDIPKMIANNFIRYRRIGRLNKKYFSIYASFYLLCFVLICIFLLRLF